MKRILKIKINMFKNILKHGKFDEIYRDVVFDGNVHVKVLKALGVK